MNTVGRLFGRYISNLPDGRLQWIGLRPARKQAMVEVDAVMAMAEMGLEGDRRCEGTKGSSRQVTIISEEYIDLIAKFTGRDHIAPSVLRRNLVVEGINLTALRHQRFTIGEAEFEATAQCHPCVRMEQALGAGGVAAMLGHGGLCAKILKTGTIRVGDKVSLIKAQGDLF
ncbi:MAG: MOSC domain-containing protein YiiM [Lentisphaeria bacterium]|jgi:MOSC domain-containing protein YiiM